ncbi:hypothetical protein Ctob_013723 [Chrysochromulina tobinii]|uniref:Ankyrin repeat protein n=1 Tax=Chrysochromulina tobinii TaxID=1460289 RepID=A0A0M0KA47_9EUKA|nr:hypothetical protein Ctob_013723 [Chrysochromulina tobinii]|eukprot:KOO35293.1 hypothetical protein Ctob_013723 [Chrysochromulina sp. CCMP291]
MGLGDPSYALRWKIRMGDTGAVRNLIKAGEADLMQPSKTLKEWTPLHIACWGSIKPTSDKDLVEALLLWAQKSGKTNAMTSATDKDGFTPLDLAKQRRDALAAATSANANAEEGGAAVEAKRKYDKIIEWLEKGLPA